MFWIYGGGYIAGTADSAFYDPTPFLEENIIVVSFNYRLGMFTPLKSTKCTSYLPCRYFWIFVH